MKESVPKGLSAVSLEILKGRRKYERLVMKCSFQAYKRVKRTEETQKHMLLQLSSPDREMLEEYRAIAGL